MSTIRGVADSLLYFHAMLFEPGFMKTFRVGRASERRISLPLRFFLAGWFFEVSPETNAANMPRVDGAVGRPKQIDFLIGNLALEIASRSSSEGLGKLYAGSNRSEIQKLLRHEGKMLCLFDLENRSEHPDCEFLTEYQNFDPMGKGNWSKYPYHAAYFYRAEGDSYCKGPLRIAPKKFS